MWAIPAKVFVTARNGDCRVCEAGRRSEPVSGGDVEPTAGTHSRRSARYRECQDQAEGGDDSPQAFPRPPRAFTDSSSSATHHAMRAQAPRMPKAIAQRCRRRRRSAKLRARGDEAHCRVQWAPEIGPKTVISTNRIARPQACCRARRWHCSRHSGSAP